MLGRLTDLCRWLFLAGLLFRCSSCQSVSSTFENKTGGGGGGGGENESKPRVFSPRMDYDEWTPLGRGDPLKNNPTFDYVPPVLDRVQYWLDSHTTEPSAKRDILVLGVTAKKTSPKIPEQFLKFVDGPKFTRSSQQDVSYRNDFTGSTGAEPPKIVRTSNFRNGPIDYRNQNRIQSIPASYYPSPFYNEKSKPYTMMLPPPLTQKEKIVSFVESTEQQFNTQTEEGPVLQESQFYARLPPSKSSYVNSEQQQPGKFQSPQALSNFSPSKTPIKTVSQVETMKSVYSSSPSHTTKLKYGSITTPSSVSFEKSNLIYQSTQTVSAGWPAVVGNGAPFSTPSISSSDAGQSIRQTTDYSRDQYEIDQHVAAASSNHEVVVEQNANIIVDGDSNENEEVVVGQKGIDSSNTVSPATTVITTSTSSSPSYLYSSVDTAMDEKEKEKENMHIVVANSPVNLDVGTTQEAKKDSVAVVMPINYSEKKFNTATRNSETLAELSAETNTSGNTSVGVIGSSSVLENSTTLKTEAINDSSTFQSVRNPLIFSEESSHPLPNKMISGTDEQPATMAPSSSRHPVDSLLSFGPPVQPLVSSMMHLQGRPGHGTMHYLGSMRPSVAFRAPASIPMFPPMTHMHAPPPPRSTIDQSVPHSSAHPSPQLHDFPAAFVNSPAPSTLNAHSIGAQHHFLDRHRSRLPDTTTAIFTTPTSSPFLPTTVSSSSSSSSTHAENLETVSLHRLPDKTAEESSSSTPRITTVPSLTTDPIFSHYKQPAKPIRGPMYLIIQGHSKVKTYKPTLSKHGIPVERNEISESMTERQLSKFEQFVQENTKNRNPNNRGNIATTRATTMGTTAAIEKKKAEEKARAEKLGRTRENDLMSLVESGLASFTVSPSSSTTEDEHRANSVTTIEINGY